MGHGLFTLPDTDSDLNPGTDIHPKNGYSHDGGSESGSARANSERISYCPGGNASFQGFSKSSLVNVIYSGKVFHLQLLSYKESNPIVFGWI